MRGNNLGGMYDRLTAEERFHLLLEAAARRDETEVERLANTCRRHTYTFTWNDLAFGNRLRASRQITIDVCLALMQALAKLTVIRTSQECVALLSRSLVTEFDRGYLRGWEDGCSDPGQSAPATSSALASEGQKAGGGDDDAELEAVAEALATEVRTLWEAFSRFCRAEMGAEPETVVLAWFPPMQGWIEGTLNAADGGRVDPDVLLEYETALTNAWHEFLRKA